MEEKEAVRPGNRSQGVRRRLDALATILLLVGLTCAAFIYQEASLREAGSPDAIGYEEGSQGTYPILPEDSKSYRQSMELYGGKANLLADDFRRWFSGLWHGTSLAYTVAFVTILLAGTLFGEARYLVDPGEDDGRDRGHRPGHT
jgi:hypothetical protein